MSGRKLGRLLGATLALVALAALTTGISGVGSGADLRNTDIEWGAPFQGGVSVATGSHVVEGR